jgi:hypothetical protein
LIFGNSIVKFNDFPFFIPIVSCHISGFYQMHYNVVVYGLLRVSSN